MNDHFRAKLLALAAEPEGSTRTAFGFLGRAEARDLLAMQEFMASGASVEYTRDHDAYCYLYRPLEGCPMVQATPTDAILAAVAARGELNPDGTDR